MKAYVLIKTEAGKTRDVANGARQAKAEKAKSPWWKLSLAPMTSSWPWRGTISTPLEGE